MLGVHKNVFQGKRPILALTSVSGYRFWNMIVTSSYAYYHVSNYKDGILQAGLFQTKIDKSVRDMLNCTVNKTSWNLQLQLNGQISFVIIL
jgi:hypothetical protein